MPTTILLDEIHVSVTASAALSKSEVNAILRTLRSKRFHASLRDAVRRVIRRLPSLRSAQFTISR